MSFFLSFQSVYIYMHIQNEIYIGRENEREIEIGSSHQTCYVKVKNGRCSTFCNSPLRQFVTKIYTVLHIIFVYFLHKYIYICV